LIGAHNHRRTCAHRMRALVDRRIEMSYGRSSIYSINGPMIMILAIPILCVLAATSWHAQARTQAKGQTEKAAVDEIVTRRLVIVGDDGRKRAALGIMRDGEVWLEFRDKQGEVRTYLNHDVVAAPSIHLMGAPEKPLIELGSAEGRAPMFIVRDDAGKRRLGVTVTRDGITSLLLSDGRGKTRSDLSVSKDAEPMLALRDGAGNVRASMVLQKDGTCAFDLRDSKGRPRLTIQVDERGQPALVAWSETGKALWSAPKTYKED